MQFIYTARIDMIVSRNIAEIAAWKVPIKNEPQLIIVWQTHKSDRLVSTCAVCCSQVNRNGSSIERVILLLLNQKCLQVKSFG
jgi:hypothetical protein